MILLMVQKSRWQPPFGCIPNLVNNEIRYQPQLVIAGFFHQQYDYKIVHYIFFLCFCSHHLRVNFFWANPWDAVDFTMTQPEDLVVFSPWILGAPKPRCCFCNIQILVVIRNPVEVIFCRMPLEKNWRHVHVHQKIKQIFLKIGYSYGTCNPYCLTRLLLGRWFVLCSDSKPMLKSTTTSGWVLASASETSEWCLFLVGMVQKISRTKSQDGSTTTFVINGGYNPYKWPYRWVTGGYNHFKFVRVNALSYSK